MLRSICLLALAGSLAAAGCRAAEPVDLLIRNATILTIDPDMTVIEGGMLAVRDGRIIALGDDKLADGYEAGETIDAGGDILMPGMINLHNHVSMIAFRGLGEYEVENLLFDVMFPLEREMLDRDLIRVSARQAAIELAMSGVTTFADMYYHEDEVARGVKAVGIRGVLGETVIGFPVVDAEEPHGGLAYAERFIAEWQGDPLIVPAVAPHAPYTVDKDMLLAAKALSDRTNAPMLMHLVEFPNEYEMVAERHPDMPEHRSEIAWLDSIGFLGPRLLAAHVVWLDEADMDVLKARGVGIAHNPKANSKGASGISPAYLMMRKGLAIGLGTDGPMSSNQMDVMSVMHYAASVARLSLGDAKPYTPVELVRMATMGGAEALDMADRIGSLEIGKRADFILIDRDTPQAEPGYDPYFIVAFGAWPTDVRLTVVEGRIVMRERALPGFDRASHEREWRAVKARVAEFAKTLGDGALRR